jgi:alkyl hydroperoxide reductase subunit AhpC
MDRTRETRHDRQGGRPAPPGPGAAYVRDQAEPVSLEIGRSEGSWTVLFFHPRDFASVTPGEDAIVMAASTDSWYVHRAWFDTAPALRDVTYPVIADPAQELTRRLGVLDATDGSARPAILRALRSDERVLQLVA